MSVAVGAHDAPTCPRTRVHLFRLDAPAMSGADMIFIS